MDNNNEQKIAKLDNDYAKEQTVKYQEQHRQVVFRRRRLTLVLGLTLVVFVIVGIQLFRDHQRLQSLREIRQESVSNHQIIADNVADLQRDVKLLEDEDYVAKLARSRFYYSKADEHVYPLPESELMQDKDNQKVQKAIESNQSSTTEK